MFNRFTVGPHEKEHRISRSSESQRNEPGYLQDASKPKTGWYRRLVTSNTTDLIQLSQLDTQPPPILGTPWWNLYFREAERPFVIVGDLVSLAWRFRQPPIRRDVGGFQASRWPKQSMGRQCHAVSLRQLRGKPQHWATKNGIPEASALSRPTAATEIFDGVLCSD